MADFRDRMPSKEQVMDVAKGGWEVTKANFLTLKDAGLFKGEHLLSFTKELVMPLAKENMDVASMQAIILARTSDLVVSCRPPAHSGALAPRRVVHATTARRRRKSPGHLAHTLSRLLPCPRPASSRRRALSS